MKVRFYKRRGQKRRNLADTVKEEKRFVSKIVDYINPYAEPMKVKLTFPFDYEEAKKRGVFVSAMPQTGKSNLAKILADYLMCMGCIVKVFDNSKVWLKSSVPTYQTIDASRNQMIYNPISVSTIFDISRLYPDEYKYFIATVIGEDFQLASSLPIGMELPFWIFYVLEESQLLMPSGSLRANYAQETFRLVSVGANFNMRYIAITQRPADVSVKMVSRTGQRYFGSAWEANDIRKLSDYTNWKRVDTLDRFSGLGLGEFYYMKGRNIELINTPEFQTDIIPVKYEKTSWFKRWFKKPTPKGDVIYA